MSRLSFLIGLTLLFVAGATTFMITFDRESSPSPSNATRNPGKPSPSSLSTRRALPSSPDTNPSSDRNAGATLALTTASTAHLTPEELSLAHNILAQTHKDAREKLNQLTHQYKLTKSQRQQALPYLLAHHQNAHPAMTLNGSPLPIITPGTTLDDNLASLLDPTQQDSLIEATLDNDAWWQDVVGQLESDLDTAIDNGEMIPTDDEPAATGPTLTDTPAPGDGQSSGHSGGNLFDLLGR